MFQVSSSLPQDNPGIKAFGSLNFPPVKILVLLFSLLTTTINIYQVLNMCQALSKALTFFFFFLLNSPNSLESKNVYGSQFKDEETGP